MGPFIIFLIVVLSVVSDFLWIDQDRKRWGWMSSWSNRNQALFFIGFILVTGLVYLAMSIKYI
ncbi:hypothetical protein [Fredinandcohnia quinoae]|uniref:Uncharacterized protein n=1 Tax=Fredinandcohnia quinoae TaxID=2918902 RepID=A0AAW5E1D7_9BACI|nr:hypothetical protein [Fredinandcohnia sp. SECRCQ15]MCH1626732.1 hypothetical protein [Fredinandcohnia sp. SECRCQ15]